jgi:hypothetical protein
MELSDAEFEMLHNIIFDECIYPSPSKYSEEDTELISDLFEKVSDEAKRRGFWWAR